MIQFGVGLNVAVQVFLRCDLHFNGKTLIKSALIKQMIQHKVGEPHPNS